MSNKKKWKKRVLWSGAIFICILVFAWIFECLILRNMYSANVDAWTGALTSFWGAVLGADIAVIGAYIVATITIDYNKKESAESKLDRYRPHLIIQARGTGGGLSDRPIIKLGKNPSIGVNCYISNIGNDIAMLIKSSLSDDVFNDDILYDAIGTKSDPQKAEFHIPSDMKEEQCFYMSFTDRGGNEYTQKFTVTPHKKPIPIVKAEKPTLVNQVLD